MPNEAVKSFAHGSPGRPVLRACSRMALPLLRDHLLHAERRLPGRYVFNRRDDMFMRLCSTRIISTVLLTPIL